MKRLSKHIRCSYSLRAMEVLETQPQVPWVVGDIALYIDEDTLWGGTWDGVTPMVKWGVIDSVSDDFIHVKDGPGVGSGAQFYVLHRTKESVLFKGLHRIHSEMQEPHRLANIFKGNLMRMVVPVRHCPFTPTDDQGLEVSE